ncbi:winged helix-turn-helix domain-containing protein [Nonomuraea sp. MCN248]|uniref:Winged helix-turn-helix domain-containing protein n=1 Tax=Nonomuraea corallina TaxID=2989783 RepID=A0ABT4S8J6_9ACTN|nr:winged helix-turn-helix domain-containing protein [Nonomuraea corallina]MDA0633533.1 winged helix-turn-helix domain-containing protein [Nonomuraea corallina]
MSDVVDRKSGWTFLTNHARVLIAVATDPQTRLRDIAATIGITERAAQGIVSDLEEAGYLERIRIGRRNHYQIDPSAELRHHTEAGIPVQALIDMFRHRDLGADRAGDPG